MIDVDGPSFFRFERAHRPAVTFPARGENHAAHANPFLK
jgi:hypothetical protein